MLGEGIMAGLLSGLEGFGLGNLNEMNLFEDKEKEEVKEVKKKEPVVAPETDFLFDKNFTCPVCEEDFKAKTVKSGKVRLIGTDMDLRPKYENLDMLKYDVILCPHCGYASLTRYFKFIAPSQKKMIMETISKNFKAKTNESEVYTYEEALERYKLALANAIVKQAKASEKAYICLKAAWLLRGKSESLSSGTQKEEMGKIKTEEEEFLKNAYEGFLAARQTETFPMCGMDEETVDYLIASLALRFKQYDVSTRLISTLLTSKTASERMKDKAREIKEQILSEIKKQQANKMAE